MFENLIVPCCMGEGHPCVCGPDERVLRAYARDESGLPPMTSEQREWCLEEADRAGEGAYPPEQAKNYSDKDLAHWVLNAWNDYVHSNCL
jgi:hypothetical protein